MLSIPISIVPYYGRLTISSHIFKNGDNKYECSIPVR